MKKIVCALALITVSGATHAASCEQDFQAIGDPRNGLAFMGDVTMPGLSVRSALGQMQQIAKDKGYEVGNETIEGNSGVLLFSQTNVSPNIVMRATAESSGEVTLGTKFPRGKKVEVAQARTEICSILGSLKSGKEGEAIAAAARATGTSGKLIVGDAVKLSAEIGKDVKKTMAPLNSKGLLKELLLNVKTVPTNGEVAETFAPVRAKYLGRKYQVDGQIYTISRNSYTGSMDMQYLVTPTRGLLGIRQSSDFNNLNFGIACAFAPDQAKLFVTLSEGDFVTLVGTVSEIQLNSMELSDCRQAQ